MRNRPAGGIEVCNDERLRIEEACDALKVVRAVCVAANDFDVGSRPNAGRERVYAPLREVAEHVVGERLAHRECPHRRAGLLDAGALVEEPAGAAIELDVVDAVLDREPLAAHGGAHGVDPTTDECRLLRGVRLDAAH